MANRIVSVHAGIYGMGIYAIMLPSSGFSVAHLKVPGQSLVKQSSLNTSIISKSVLLCTMQ